MVYKILLHGYFIETGYGLTLHQQINKKQSYENNRSLPHFR